MRHGWDVKPIYATTTLFGKDAELGLTKKEMGAYSITLSSPERAIMEILNHVPKQASFEEARLLFGGLTTLLPQLAQKLLERCNSIKVTRLFMFLAEKLSVPLISCTVKLPLFIITKKIYLRALKILLRRRDTIRLWWSARVSRPH